MLKRYLRGKLSKVFGVVYLATWLTIMLPRGVVFIGRNLRFQLRAGKLAGVDEGSKVGRTLRLRNTLHNISQVRQTTEPCVLMKS